MNDNWQNIFDPSSFDYSINNPDLNLPSWSDINLPSWSNTNLPPGSDSNLPFEFDLLSSDSGLSSFGLENVIEKIEKIVTMPFHWVKSFYQFVVGQEFSNWVEVITGFLIVAILFFIFYWLLRILKIRNDLHDELNAIMEASPEVRKKNERWERVLRHINSPNPADWRLAIIEADTILDEMVLRMGYKGETLGERLKNIEPSDFNTLNQAWEAHKIRNKIAHDGSEFELNRRKAMQTISLYEEVFHEFRYI